MSHEAILLVIFNIGYVTINFVLIDVTQSFLESIPTGRKMVRNKNGVPWSQTCLKIEMRLTGNKGSLTYYVVGP